MRLYLIKANIFTILFSETSIFLLSFFLHKVNVYRLGVLSPEAERDASCIGKKDYCIGRSALHFGTDHDAEHRDLSSSFTFLPPPHA